MQRHERVGINSNQSGLLAKYSRLLEYNSSYCNITAVRSNGVTYGIVPEHFKIKTRTLLVGKGRKDFEKASRLMKAFKSTNSLNWVKVISSSDVGLSKSDEPVAVGSTLAVLANVYNTFLWTLNPVRVISSSYSTPSIDPDTQELFSEITYSTLEGHLMEGDERFRVSMLPSFRSSSPALFGTSVQAGDVLFEVTSYAKGYGLLGTLCFPLIKPLQDKFLRDTTISMQKLMRE